MNTGIDNALFYKNYTGEGALTGPTQDGELSRMINDKLNKRYATSKNKKNGHAQYTTKP